LSSFFFLIRTRPPTSSTLFPYTTLFRSREQAVAEQPVTPDEAESADAGGSQAVPAASTTAGRVDELRRRHAEADAPTGPDAAESDRKSTRLNSSHLGISYAVFCLKKKKK